VTEKAGRLASTTAITRKVRIREIVWVGGPNRGFGAP